MAALSHLTPLETAYPSRLRALVDPPASLTSQGGPVEAAHAIAIVGSRSACPEALTFAVELAAALVRAGAVVVSGGAVGVDAAAHEGALLARGRTWAVAGTGHAHCFPACHASLFRRIGDGPGAMVWPFSPDYQGRSGFLLRNRVLVALSDALVVVQAGLPSGALQAASWARKLNKPLWVVPAAPWMAAFDGSRALLEQGARPVTSIEAFLAALGLGLIPASGEAGPSGSVDAIAAVDSSPPGLSPEAFAVLQATSIAPLHVDAIGSRAGQTAQSVGAALLTLALENVVVEGPPGFFRRTKAHNR